MTGVVLAVALAGLGVARPAAAAEGTAPAPGTVALTFDDGPDPRWTPQVLDVLDRYGVKATFFVLGGAARRRPDLVRLIVARGHTVASHGMSHPKQTRLRGNRLAGDVNGGADVLQAIAGSRPRCQRPPYGAHNARTDAVVRAAGMEPVLWTIDPRDWTRPRPAVVVARVLSRVRGGSIVLMHDGGGVRAATVAALPAIVEGIRARGLGFDTICSQPPPPPAPPAPTP